MKKNLQNNPTTYKEGGRDNPIGVFDSGVGGLTVVKELVKSLPFESIVYFGDTARVPYGTKSKQSVVKFSGEIVDFLLKKEVKLILVACNTASAVALESLRRKTKIPVIGVIDSGAVAAASASKNKKIGVVGTTATIKSGAYKAAIGKYVKNATVIQKACPLFVPLVEEGWIKKTVTENIAREYLLPLKKTGCDAVILGCTHYPLMKNVIKKILGRKIILVDSATEVTKKVANILLQKNLTRKGGGSGKKYFYVSDAPEKFKQLGKIFLGKTITKVTKINIEPQY